MDISTSYSDAMGKITPGSFVPDIGVQSAPSSTPLPDDSGDNGGVSFKDTLAGMIGSVNDRMIDAGQKSQDLAMGKTNDTESVVKSVEEAQLSFQMAMSVRNKLMQAYTEISQMQF
jgi:flagellar hook-basal body complex protein FliE